MIYQIIFTITAFILFLYILFFKLVRKNDTTYLLILALQAFGILLNLLKINFNILNRTYGIIILYLLCIVIPLLVFILENKGINVSEIIMISNSQIYLWFNKTKKAKRILISLVTKYKNSYWGHKKLAYIYEKEGGMRKAIDEYVKVLDIKKDDYKSYYKISSLLNDLGQIDEAEEMLCTLSKSKPEIYDATKMLRRNIYKKT